MYAIDLICSNGHRFEAWFSNRSAFENQRNKGLIRCAICSDKNMQQALSAARIKKHADAETREEPKEKKKKMPNIIEYIENHFEDVGPRFTDEAIRIHHGETERRNIRGTATADEEQTLTDEGISFFKIPQFQ